MKKILLSGAAALMVLGAMTIAAPPQALAEMTKPQAQALQARQGYMRMLALNLGPLGAMAKGEADYDAAKAKTHAGNLQSLAGVDLGHVWVAGTDNGALKGETTALPKLFAEQDKVAEKAAALKTAADALAAAAGNGLDALKGAMGGMGQACKGCHEEYREKQ